MDDKHFVVASLERKPGFRWGISLSFFRSKYLIVGAADQTSLSGWICGLYACPCHVDPSLLWNAPINVTCFIKHLFSLPSYPTIQTLLPGDCILAINYRPVVNFSSLTEITDALTNCNKACLLVLRSPFAVQRAALLSGTLPYDGIIFSNQIATESLKFYERFDDVAFPKRTNVVFSPTKASAGKRKPPAAVNKPPAAVNKPPAAVNKPPAAVNKKQNVSTLISRVQERPSSISTGTLRCCFRNPLFFDAEGKHLPYFDDGQSHLYDEKALSGSQLNNSELEDWQRCGIEPAIPTLSTSNVSPGELVADQSSGTTPVARSLSFQSPQGSDEKLSNRSHFHSNCATHWDPDDGIRAPLFLRPIEQQSFGHWLSTRKVQWRKNYQVYKFEPDLGEELKVDNDEEEKRTVAVDFWTSQGFSSFQQWLTESTSKWKASYSWNRRKRKLIEQDCDEVVQLSEQNFVKWLRVRKSQWRVLRRKRQRERQERDIAEVLASVAITSPENLFEQTSPRSVIQHPYGGHKLEEFAVIDSLLEDRERQQRLAQTKLSFDLSLLLNPSHGAPDDIVVHFMEFLQATEQNSLLSLNRVLRRSLIERSQVWRSLCPTRWKLPRRPRKPWHHLYFLNLKAEREQARKRFDDLLAKAAQLMFKGDQLHSIEKMVAAAEQEFSFDINYSSGVVCEQNSLLNLAAIHKRHKVVRWLVETKHADIESCDRGSFTPLLNAAWAGDKYLVRFFLQKGANRKHVGTCHYTRPLASPDFPGRTASEWARYRGHNEIANLIELGL
ncbi:hypothetical protein ACA910_020660 [Epithemia clementina (nom. ined.)]